MNNYSCSTTVLRGTLLYSQHRNTHHQARRDFQIHSNSTHHVEQLDRVRGKLLSLCTATGIDIWNPAFDVTPNALITGGIVTELGVFQMPLDTAENMAELKK